MLLKVHFNTNKKTIPTISVFVFLMTFFSFSFFPQTTNAACANYPIDTTENNMTVPVSQVRSKEYMDGQRQQAILYYKTCISDGQAQVENQKIRKAIVSSTATWVNSGMDKKNNNEVGKPYFSQNNEKFYAGLNETVTGNTLEKISPIVFGPFRENISTSLAAKVTYNSQEALKPTITEAEYNDLVNNTGGGWSSFQAMAEFGPNNPYGAMYLAQNEVDDKVATAKAKYEQQQEWSGGYFNYEKCPSDQNSQSNTTGRQVYNQNNQPVYGVRVTDSNCVTETPGATIRDGLSIILGSDLRSLEVATSWDRLLMDNPPVGKIITDTLGGAGGLATASVEGTRSRTATVSSTNSNTSNNNYPADRISQAAQQAAQDAVTKTAPRGSSGVANNNINYSSYLDTVLDLLKNNSNQNNNQNTQTPPTIFCVASTSTVALSNPTPVTWVTAVSGGLPPFSYLWFFEDNGQISTSTGQSVTKSYASSTAGVKTALVSVTGTDRNTYSTVCSNSVLVKP
jgi:hypothetical protein